MTHYKPATAAPLFAMVVMLLSCAASEHDSGDAPQASAIVWQDGDSGTIGGERFRLPDVDAPETGQVAKCDRERALGAAAHDFMMSLTSATQVEAGAVQGLDRKPNPRQLRTITVDGVDIEQRGLADGHLARWLHEDAQPLEPRPVWCLDEERHRVHVMISRSDFADVIGARDVSFVALDMETGTGYELEGSRPHERRAPWSTFKIPNLVIALETGVSDDLDHQWQWDSEKRPAAGYWPRDWRQDQTLETAFQRSAAWAFQDMALEVGTQNYRSYLSEWGYGDIDVADGSDTFWLDKTLEVSPNEQVRLLARLLSGRVDVSDETLARLRKASFAGKRPDGNLHGKTGAGPVELGNFDGRFEGWYVGFLDRDARAPIAFAVHAEASSYGAIHTFRKEFAELMLDEIGRIQVR